MNIAESITSIQNARAKEAKKLEPLRQEMIGLRKFVEEFESLKSNAAWMALVEDPKRPHLKTSWQELCKYMDEKHFIKRVSDIITVKADGNYEISGALKEIWDRMNRPYVTISVMGPISAGKSLLLQLITGLGNTVIPVNAQTCTASCTTFINSQQKKAIVEFVTTNTLLNNIMDHIDVLNSWLDNIDNTSVNRLHRNDVLAMSIGDVVSRIESCGYLNDTLYQDTPIAIGNLATIGTSKGYYNTLCGYIENFPSYNHLLGSGSIDLSQSQIENGELEQYVAYVQGGTAYAVKGVTLYWPLHMGEESLGEIRLKDTMGIGEAKIGVTQGLIKALREETDIAVALCRVQPGKSIADDVNTRTFIQVLKDSVEGREPEQWVYYLLNKYSSASEQDVLRVKQELQKELTTGNVHIELPQNHYSSFEFLTANNDKNVVGVENYFKTTILPNLASTIPAIDAHFLKVANKEIQDLISLSKHVFNMFAHIPVPSCSPDDKISKTLKDVKTAYLHMVDLKAQCEDEIQAALLEYLKNNPLGSFTADSLGYPDAKNTIHKKMQELSKSCKPHELKSKEMGVVEEILMPIIKNNYTENDYKGGLAFTRYTQAFQALIVSIGKGIKPVIEQTSIVDKVADIKSKIGEIFISDGRLSLNGVASSAWLETFLGKLNETPAEYPDLIAHIENFLDKNVDLKKDVIDYILFKIREVAYEYNDPGEYGKFTQYSEWTKALCYLLMNKENHFVGIVRNDYSAQIGHKVKSAQEIFISCVNEFVIGEDGLIPNKDVVEVPPVFVQLKKFYMNNYKDIFGDDEFQRQMTAIDKANHIRTEYCSK